MQSEGSPSKCHTKPVWFCLNILFEHCVCSLLSKNSPAAEPSKSCRRVGHWDIITMLPFLWQHLLNLSFFCLFPLESTRFFFRHQPLLLHSGQPWICLWVESGHSCRYLCDMKRLLHPGHSAPSASWEGFLLSLGTSWAKERENSPHLILKNKSCEVVRFSVWPSY